MVEPDRDGDEGDASTRSATRCLRSRARVRRGSGRPEAGGRTAGLSSALDEGGGRRSSPSSSSGFDKHAGVTGGAAARRGRGHRRASE